MKNKQRIWHGLWHWLKQFFHEMQQKPPYQVVDIYECQKTGVTKAVVKLSARHAVEKNISAVITDADFIEGLDKQTIRTLTYMATMERMQPNYAIAVQHLTNGADDCILELKSRHNHTTVLQSPTELSKNKSLLMQLGPMDANRIGYLAGVLETLHETQLKNNSDR